LSGVLHALAQSIFEIDRHAVLLQEIGEGLIGKLLNCGHPIAAELRQLVQRIVVKADQFPHRVNPSEANSSAPPPIRSECGNWCV